MTVEPAGSGPARPKLNSDVIVLPPAGPSPPPPHPGTARTSGSSIGRISLRDNRYLEMSLSKVQPPIPRQRLKIASTSTRLTLPSGPPETPPAISIQARSAAVATANP